MRSRCRSRGVSRHGVLQPRAGGQRPRLDRGSQPRDAAARVALPHRRPLRRREPGPGGSGRSCFVSGSLWCGIFFLVLLLLLLLLSVYFVFVSWLLSFFFFSSLRCAAPRGGYSFSFAAVVSSVLFLLLLLSMSSTGDIQHRRWYCSRDDDCNVACAHSCTVAPLSPILF